MKSPASLLFVLFLFLVASCQQQTEWQPVFNGKDLDNWDTYLGTPIEGHEELAQKATPEKVFSVTTLDGQPVIHISGEVNGALATKEAFENYHFHMELKWGDQVYRNRNSGLLYHSYGDFGEALDTWMHSHEMQMMTGNMGDSYRMGETYCDIPVIKQAEDRYQFKPGAEKHSFGKDGVSKIARKIKDAEMPIGRWNEIDLYCYDRMTVHVVNGETVLVNYNSGKYENGAVQPLTAGKIQIQSEGGELYLRNMKIRDIDEIPEHILP